MAQIQPIQIWKNGQLKTAESFSLVSAFDNLESYATFYYELRALDTSYVDPDGNTIVNKGEIIASGNELQMDGQDYQDWGNQAGAGINNWAYTWAANKLNITII